MHSFYLGSRLNLKQGKKQERESETEKEEEEFVEKDGIDLCIEFGDHYLIT